MNKKFSVDYCMFSFLIFLVLELNVSAEQISEEISKCIKDQKLMKVSVSALSLSEKQPIYECLFTWDTKSCLMAGFHVGSAVAGYFFSDYKGVCEQEVRSRIDAVKKQP